MPVIRAQVAIQHETQGDRDTAVNTFHFENSGDLGTVDNIADMLEDFYNAAPPGESLAIADFMSPTMADGTATISLYNLSEPKPRAPIYVRDFELLVTGTSDPIPSQCAIVLTYQTAPESGQLQRRFRNRVYLPFWKNTVVSSSGYVADQVCRLIGASAAEMLRAAAASVDNSWKVFSPTRAASGGTPEDGLSDVDGGWVDNSFDIQRRRKVEATQRFEWDNTTGT